MRVTTAFKRLVRLDGVNVTDVEFQSEVVAVTVALKRRRLLCPHCSFSTSARYDTRIEPSSWRHLDLGAWALEIRCRLRRLACPTHGVVVEGVPFARPGAHLTRDYDDLLAWLATRMDRASVARLARVSWRTVGRACERVVATELDPNRLDGLFRIGVDEISWRKHHKYLTLVVDHDRGVVVWGAKGRDSATLDGFFEELGPQRCQAIEAVSLDLGPAFIKSVNADGHAPNAVICADPMLLLLSSSDEVSLGRCEEAVDVAGGVALEAAHRASTGLALADTFVDVGTGCGVPSEADHHDAPQRHVGVPVAAAVEPVSILLP